MSSSKPGGGRSAEPDNTWAKVKSRWNDPKEPLWPFALLSAIPTLVFGVPALAGRLLLFGDNLHQNYPLRALVGAEIRHGYMPLWDPYLWSGSPLLAGFNAGAAYPATILFAIFSPFVAWTLGQIAIYAALAIGCYLLFRSSEMKPVPAVVAAATFSFAGAAAAQAVHVDMVEGLASLPWMLLAVRRIIQGRGLGWALILALASSLVVLAGAPEAMLDEAAMIALFGIFQAGTDRQRWIRLIGWSCLAAVLVLGLSAVQWLPGIGFVKHSQRAAANYTFFSSGSFPPMTALLAVVPYFLGGNGQLGQPGYYGPYNLPEVTTYIGILAITATIALASPRWRHRLPKGERRTWYGVGIASVLMALGGYTPLGHLLVHIPLYGSQRLQSRNIFGADLAGSALLGWWLDGGKAAGHRFVLRNWDRAAALIPLLITAVIAVWMILHPTGLVQATQGSPPGSSALGMAGITVAFSLALCIGAALLVRNRPAMHPRRWLKFALIFIVVDLGVYSALGQMPAAPTPAQITAHTPVANSIAVHLSSGGRYAVFDPQLYDYPGLLDAGDPDMGIVRGMPSVQGYGSIVDATYEASTSTHAQAGLSPVALANNSLDQVGLQVLASLPEYFLTPVTAAPNAAGKYVPLQIRGNGSAPYRWGNIINAGIPGPLAAVQRPPLDPYGSEGWYFGTSLETGFIQVVLSTPSTGQKLQIGTISSSGGVTWGAPQFIAKGALVAQLDTDGQVGIGARVRNLSHGPLNISMLAVNDVRSSQTFVSTGTLSSSIRPSQWSWAAKTKSWTLFVRNAQPRAVWAAASSASSTPAASATAQVHVLFQRPDGSEVVAVNSPTSFLLDRSVAYVPGWHATLNGPGESSTPLVVRRSQLIQQVAVPAGNHTVTFYYHPRKVFEALYITLASIALVALLALWLGIAKLKKKSIRTRQATPPLD